MSFQLTSEQERRGAIVSDCGRYRYSLTREWAPGSRVLWVCLNPSTADATADDPTIRRCRAFSQRWGFGSLEVVNLYAYRATDPADLTRAFDVGRDIEGPENHQHQNDAARRAALIVAAWGVHGAGPLSVAVTRRLGALGALYSIGTTKGGHPRHPLYVRGDAQPIPYPMAARVLAAAASGYPRCLDRGYAGNLVCNRERGHAGYCVHVLPSDEDALRGGT